MSLCELFIGSSTLSDEEVDYRHNELEARIGDFAYELLSQGEVLTYDNKAFQEYLAVIDMINFDRKAPPIQALKSIKNLRDFLKSGLEFSKVQSGKYHILHNDPKSRNYLATLAEQGTLTLDGDERWNLTGKLHGSRGGSILKDIDHQLGLIFNDLGLPHPKLSINHGQIKLVILDAKTREYVRQIAHHYS